MRVLLVSPPTGKNILPVVPLGLLYIAAATENAGHTIQILDLGFSRDYIMELKETVEKFAPDVVGISLRNIAECVELEKIYMIYKKIVASIKHSPLIVLGGAGFSIIPEKLLDYTGAHCGIIGEGEKEFIDVLDAFKSGELFDKKNNITKRVWKTEKIQQFTKVDIMAIRQKHWQKYGKFYAIAGSSIPIQTTRGCGNKCIYCSYPIIQGRLLRHRCINEVINEFKRVSAMPGVREVFFVDSVFNANIDYIELMINEMISRSVQSRFVHWRCCLNPKGLNDRLVDILKDAGCSGCDLGVDSFSDIVLNALKKGYTSNQAIDVAFALEKANIPYQVSLILGGPNETNKTIDETIRKVSQIRPTSIHAFIGVRVYPNTPFESMVNTIENKGPLRNDYMHPDKSSFFLQDSVKEKLRELVSNAPNEWHFTNADILKM